MRSNILYACVHACIHVCTYAYFWVCVCYCLRVCVFCNRPHHAYTAYYEPICFPPLSLCGCLNMRQLCFISIIQTDRKWSLSYWMDYMVHAVLKVILAEHSWNPLKQAKTPNRNGTAHGHSHFGGAWAAPSQAVPPPARPSTHAFHSDPTRAADRQGVYHKKVIAGLRKPKLRCASSWIGDVNGYDVTWSDKIIEEKHTSYQRCIILSYLCISFIKVLKVMLIHVVISSKWRPAWHPLGSWSSPGTADGSRPMSSPWMRPSVAHRIGAADVAQYLGRNADVHQTRRPSVPSGHRGN